jgi:hypothetical protein
VVLADGSLILNLIRTCAHPAQEVPHTLLLRFYRSGISKSITMEDNPENV